MICAPGGRAATSETATEVSALAAAPEPATIDLTALISKAAHWIRTGQYALAAHLLRPHLPAVAAAAEIAALAAAATGPSGPHEHELNARATAAHIDQLGVRHDARRAGHGRALMVAVEAQALAWNAAGVTLDVQSFNDDALAFYEALGYTVSAHRLSRPLPE